MANTTDEAGAAELVTENAELKRKLSKKNEDLSRARFRLRKARAEIVRLKQIVAYQRSRILELY